MAFVRLVTQRGPLEVVWHAAHWERRLRRHDYEDANLSVAVQLMLEHIAAMPMRCIGHLLVGLCRILRMKGVFLEQDAMEVRGNLLLSGSSSLPVVATVTESAVTLSKELRDTSLGAFWDLHGGLGPDSLGEGSLDLVLEPEYGVDMDLAACLEEGRQHVAPLERITLSSARVQTLSAAKDAFGAPSPAEQEAMEKLSQAGSPPHGSVGGSPSQAAESAIAPANPPSPVEALLGDSVFNRVDGLHLDSPDLIHPVVQVTDLPRDHLQGVPFGVEGQDLMDLTPPHLAQGLDFDDVPLPDLAEGGFGALELSPMPLIPLDDEPWHPIPPNDADDVDAIGHDVAVPGANLVPARPRSRSRRRRAATPWFDMRTEIPREVLHDTRRITQELLHEFRIFLPHSRPRVGYTTTYSDMCTELCENLLHAKELGARRRRDRADVLLRRAGAREVATLGGVDFPGSPGPSFAPGSPPPLDLGFGLAFSASPKASSPGLLGHLAAHRAALQGSPAFPAPLGPQCLAAAAGPTPGEPSPAPDIAPIDGHESPAPVPASPLPLEVGLTGALPSLGPSSCGDRVLEAFHGPPEFMGPLVKRVKLEAAEMSFEQPGLPAGAAAPMQRSQLEHAFEEDPDTEASFLGLCESSCSGPEAAARRFMGLLQLHMDGHITLSQEEAYGDIAIGRGAEWLPEAES